MKELKMEKIQESFSVGVLVGRFQVDELTDGHMNLFKEVIVKHDQVVVFLGLSPCKCTVNNPLDFQARKLMINEKFPDIKVYYINDIGSDVLWSDTLDKQIAALRPQKNNVCLYGSRDSFIQYYCGRFPTCVIDQEVMISGTQRRKELASRIERSADFRRGVIWGTMNQYSRSLPTVDIALFNEDYSKVLLARKEFEQGYRFVGGFCQPGETFEDTTIRETAEETHLNLASVEYVKSFVIDDWRYKSEVDKITTTLFKSKVTDETPVPDDDIFQLCWFPFNKHTVHSVVEEHKDMFNYLLTN